MFIVNKNLLYPFESIISVIYKLSYIDKLEYQDALKLFGIKPNRSNRPFLSGNSTNLIKVFNLQPSRYFLYKIDYIGAKSFNTSHALRPENITPFVFCPKCTKYNFHAVFHSSYFRLCLIHGCVLTTRCPSCESRDLTRKSGVIYCTKCKHTLFNEDKFLPDEDFKKLILKEVIPFKNYINRHVKDNELFNVVNVNICNILGSCNFKKLLFHIKKYYFWMSIVLRKPYIYTSIDYSIIAKLDQRFKNTNEWLTLFVDNILRQFERVYIRKFDSLIEKSNLENEIKLGYKNRSKEFQKKILSNKDLALRLRTDLKDIEYPIIFKYKKLVAYLLRKRLTTYLRLAYFDALINEKYFTKKLLRRPYIDYIFFYLFVTEGRKVELYIFDQRPMGFVDRRFNELIELEKISNSVECYIYQIDIKAYVSSLYPYEIF